MSTKHFFAEPRALVPLALQSFVQRHPNLDLDPVNRVVFSKSHQPSQIAIISGGGSGHEPAWSGYVGDGMLAAAVCGDIFASPSTKQIMAGIRSVPSNVGIILCITNYTGDKLHFGLAREKGLALGHRVDVVNMSEDAALGKEKAGLVGRRGLAGNLLVLKLIGAANHQAWSFDSVLKLGNLGNSHLVTIGTSLDHCHVPGRSHHEAVPANACVLGMGIHNEPGLQTISPIPSADSLVKQMYAHLLDPSDPDRAFVTFNPKDEVVMLINNFGGLSNLELEALANIAGLQLEADWDLLPIRIYAGTFESSLNGPGFSITVGNLTGIAQAMELTVSDILQLLDAPTTAPAWPKNSYLSAKPSEECARLREKAKADAQAAASQDQGPPVTAKIIRALTEACKRARAAEPDITKYDILMGDGDCGEAVDMVCNSILTKLHSDLSPNSPLFSFLEQVGDCVEDMGGSLGAILSIFLTAFSSQLRQAYRSSSDVSITTVSKTIGPALDVLKQYTSARVGDRTVMDALIPFCETLQQSGELAKSVQAAQRGADTTKGMRAKFGRATYVGDEKLESQSDIPPDPGAYAAAVFLGGLSAALLQ
ncbi:dihydroxyacetone kinase [Pseudovirgaria hyperparasitica]|uniref:Dihydroxyacetone kinase n=1 Tax=Pseudovirgaria hyperparasitica TaxID=470096 RepID=A0A6A6WKN3_9PEZI|nr:dihydroxyacetone kinase [Pseudovirgaria hyperparasitica]KAF2762760.1 dihydroxyacetone kinase [Pseudovirgaria hyperparasitica]